MDTLTYILKKYWSLDKYIPKDFDIFGMPLDVPGVSRHDLATLFAELGFNKGAEIGVEQGVYSEVLLKANPKLYLHLIDSWKVYKEYRDHTRQEKLDRFYEETTKRLNPYGYRYGIWKMFSLDAIQKFEDNSLDFVYIDANHDFINVTNDLHFWMKKVRKGGIISGHDYYKDHKYDHVHVKQVLDGYTHAYKIRPWFLFGDSWAIVKQ